MALGTSRRWHRCRRHRVPPPRRERGERRGARRRERHPRSLRRPGRRGRSRSAPDRGSRHRRRGGARSARWPHRLDRRARLPGRGTHHAHRPGSRGAARPARRRVARRRHGAAPARLLVDRRSTGRDGCASRPPRGPAASSSASMPRRWRCSRRMASLAFSRSSSSSRPTCCSRIKTRRDCLERRSAPPMVSSSSWCTPERGRRSLRTARVSGRRCGPPPPGEAQDTTGAGRRIRRGLSACTATGDALDAALAEGHRCAARTLDAPGASVGAVVR